MRITPEEESACDPQLLSNKVIEILRQCRPLPHKMHYDTDTGWVRYLRERLRDGPIPQWYPSLVDPLRTQIEPTPLSDPWLSSRRFLRGRVLEWLLDPHRDRNLFWITDPFSVGGLPVAAQALAGILEGIQRLGTVVSCFQALTPTRVIMRIVHNLNLKYPPYRRLVLKEFVNDPTIFSKSPRIVFRRLIVEPWGELANTHPFYLQNPPLIVVVFKWDWGNDKTSELVELIAEYSSPYRRSPLLWLVSSHPRYHHMKSIASSLDRGVVFEHQLLFHGDVEAKEEIRDLLYDSLQEIRRRHPDLFSEGEAWPTQGQSARLTINISGVYPFAHSILRYVGAEGKNSKTQLEISLMCMAGSPAPSNLNPFRAYHYFLQRLLVNTAPDAIPLLVDFDSTFGTLKAQAAAHLLGLGESEYHHAIENIFCFFVTPLGSSLHPLPNALTFRDEGFKFFCKGGFCESWDSNMDSLAPAKLQILEGSLHILGSSRISVLLDTLRWSSSTPVYDLSTINSLRGRVPRVDYDRTEEAVHYLRSFDFRCLAGASISVTLISKLVRHLHGFFPDFARTEPLTPLDQQFIDKCKMVATPMTFEDYASSGINFKLVEYVLLGHGDQTVLVLCGWVPPPGDPPMGILDDNVAIYSSDMLDQI